MLSHLPEDIKITDLVDAQGFTLLHMAIFKNKTNIMEALLEEAKGQLMQYEVANWVNQKTFKDKFTAIHYASFRGNIAACNALVDNGADINAKNQYGLNVMHIVAQGDQPISLFYFKQLNIDLTSRDNRGSTPLHWACFQNSEIALLYLLGWLSQSRL